MSAATASSTELVTILVRLLDEGVDVWRPVPARRLSAATYQLADTPAPKDERWSFPPGASVVAEPRALDAGVALVAVARASAFDAPSLSSLVAVA